ENPGFDQDISRILGVPVKQTDIAAAHEIIKPEQRPNTWIPYRMDNALALALAGTDAVNGFNFRQGPFAAQKFWVEHKKNLIKTGILTALVLAALFSNVLIDIYIMQKKLTRLNRQITEIFTSTFPDVKKIVDPYQQMQVNIETAKKDAIFPGKNIRNIRSIDILNDISRRIPNEIDVHLSRLDIGPDSVVIAGDTNTFNAVDDIKSRLEQADFFKKITISSANIDRSENRVRFKLKVNL
ncbi:MAG: PilN domain-containing protein, partial [Proteobacteria bacterium]|nr:PilN domain-containing protein [Pseudomonadota bacterium]